MVNDSKDKNNPRWQSKNNDLPKEEDLQTLRKEIDQIDKQILELLKRRAKVAKKIGEIKRSKGLKIYIPEREKEILEKLLKENNKEFPEEALKTIFLEIFSACRSLQEPLKVGYLGPEASFTHQAALEQFGSSTSFIPLPTIGDIFEEVERENIDYGVVPVENTIEGVVNYTLDMFLEKPNIKIVGEIVIPVAQHLMSRSGDLSKIKKVYSHPHALAQVRNWLDKYLPHAERIEVESTAKAAQLAKEDEQAAAVASKVAARVYNLQILKKNIQDRTNNYTRFLVIGKDKTSSPAEQTPPKGGVRYKTSVLFAVEDEAGALYRALEPFYRHKVNLTKIESRPSKEKSWDYVFFIDLDGHVLEENVKKALQELKERTKMVRILGTYPKEV